MKVNYAVFLVIFLIGLCRVPLYGENSPVVGSGSAFHCYVRRGFAPTMPSPPNNPLRVVEWGLHPPKRDGYETTAETL